MPESSLRAREKTRVQGHIGGKGFDREWSLPDRDRGRAAFLQRPQRPAGAGAAIGGDERAGRASPQALPAQLDRIQNVRVGTPHHEAPEGIACRQASSSRPDQAPAAPAQQIRVDFRPRLQFADAFRPAAAGRKGIRSAEPNCPARFCETIAPCSRRLNGYPPPARSAAAISAHHPVEHTPRPHSRHGSS